GLPGIPPVFLSDPAAKHRAAYAPGKQFHYNNMAFTLLGRLLMSLDGGSLPEIYRKRIFDPLGMTATEPVITFDQRDRTAKNYFAFQSDRFSSTFAGTLSTTGEKLDRLPQSVGYLGRPLPERKQLDRQYPYRASQGPVACRWPDRSGSSN